MTVTEELGEVNLTIGELSSEDEFVFEIYSVVVPVLFSLIVAVGCVGNALVIFVICRCKSLQTATNLLILNLAASDLAFLLVCGGFSVAHYVLAEWPLGTTLCRLIQYLLYVTAYVTVYTLTAISVVRYITVVYGCDHFLIREKRYIIVMSMVIWIIFILAKIPILIVHGVTYNTETERLECIVTGKLEGQQIFATFFMFAYALPLAVIATLYLLIVRHLRHQRSQLLHQHMADAERQGKVTRTLTVLVLTFSVCWLPLHIHLLVAYYGSLPNSVIYKLLVIVWHCLVYVNSMLNPLIYNASSADFRNSFRHAVCCRAEPVPL